MPPQYEEVDVGDLEAVRCLTKAIWLIEFDGTPCSILLTCENGRYGGETGVRIQFAAIDGQEGHRVSSIFFRSLERAVNESKCYRGKILSFENTSEYRGHAVGITVHKLKSVNRDQVILPLRTALQFRKAYNTGHASTVTDSEAGWDWHARMNPFASSPLESASRLSILTRPDAHCTLH